MTWPMERGLINDKDEVRLTLELDTTESAVIQELQSGLEASGIRVTAQAGNLMDLAIPIEVLLPVLESGGEDSLITNLSGLEHVVGSAMAAELGTMRVTEQIDALESMGANPIYYLVVPRFLGCLLLIPSLTVMADFMGVLGGYFYSAPPLRLEGSGWGELNTAILTALLVPVTGYVMKRITSIRSC